MNSTRSPCRLGKLVRLVSLMPSSSLHTGQCVTRQQRPWSLRVSNKSAMPTGRRFHCLLPARARARAHRKKKEGENEVLSPRRFPFPLPHSPRSSARRSSAPVRRASLPRRQLAEARHLRFQISDPALPCAPSAFPPRTPLHPSNSLVPAGAREEREAERDGRRRTRRMKEGVL